MITLLIDVIKGLGVKDGVIAVLVVLVGYTATMWHNASLQAQNVKTIYTNPQIKTVEKIVYKQGPVITRTVIKEVPGGGKETTIDQTQSPVAVEVVASTESTPVPLAQTLTPTRTDRYLLGFSNLNFTPNQLDHYSLWGGYSIKNRVDLLYGIGYNERFNQNLMVVLRF